MQRDFIMRMIERLGALFTAIRKIIIGGGDSAEIRESLQEASQQAGFDLQLVESLDLESILLHVSPGGDLDFTRCWAMAEVMLLDGLHAVEDERPADAAALLWKSRALFDLLRKDGGAIAGFDETDDRLHEIDALLDTVAEPA